MHFLPEIYLWIVVGVLGAIVGSFLNVCILRFPQGESIIFPGSHCANCRHSLSWYENIPLFSFFFLRAKCRHCHAAISWQYPLVELFTIFFSLLTWWWFRDILSYLLYFLFFIAPLMVISFIDLKHLIIPDSISLPGIVVGLIVRLLLAPEGTHLSALMDGVIGILVGGGTLFLIAFAYEKIKKREGLGGGDVKLMAMLGAFFGWQATLFIMLLSSVLGLLIGIVLMIFFRKGFQYQLPFGPFIAFAGIIYLFIGPQMVSWYLSLF